MEGRRRRAQRLTQHIDEQPELEEIRADAPQEPCEEASLHTPEQPPSPRRRRQAQPIHDEPVLSEQAASLLAESQAEHIEPAGAPNPEKKKNRPNKQEEKQKKRYFSAAKTLRGEHVRRVAAQSAKVGKTALQGLGGLLVLAMLLAGEGTKKLSASAKALYAHIGANRKPQTQAQNTQEYILEPVKPEDYHGRGQAHAEKTDSPARKHAAGQTNPARALMLNRMVSALLMCVVLVSAWQIGSILLRSIRTHRLNEQLSSQRAAMMESADAAQQEEEQDTTQPDDEAALTAAPQETPAPTPTPEPEEEAESAPQSTPVPDVVKSTKYHQLGGDALPEMAALHEQNRDLVAWIQIPDVLDLPVVYRDNSYYLTRDFNKQKNAAGTIFLDENHPFKEKTQNLLLHGHNMKDGTMFGRLAQYLYDDSYIRNHPFIYFDTLWKKEQYVIIAVLDVSLKTGDPRFFNYFTHDTFSFDTEFASYIRQLQLRSKYAIPIDVQPSDALLTLSTCLDDDRLVIVARRLRENETRSELRTLIRMTTKQ